MELQIIFNIVIVVLLVTVIVILLISRKKTPTDEILALLKHGNDELRNSVAKQLSDGTTEQFRRFDVIQSSVQQTLTTSREEQGKQMRNFQEQIDKRLSEIQRSSTESNERINATLESKMKSIQESNEKRLEQMQAVVDEKLQKTLETRLAKSFELVSKQLDSVQQGLGEMKNLAADAKSLKNALTNVKERGTYGEVRLEKLLSDILAPNQYETNVEIASNKRVEFAIKLPGNGDIPLLLPIDSKFPIEDYNRLLDAEDKQTIDETRKSLAQKIRVFAKDIYDKYIVPPKTTDFALMFLPTEGLYAEVVQNAALFEELRDKYKVTAVGATTLSAFLSSLQMGFKTLAIEQRSQEVWDTLRAVKSEFIKFGDILDKAHKQIQTADKTLEEIVGKRTKAINRTLNNVDVLNKSDNILLESTVDDDEN
ncbi:MAG: DNA recombination protein RmuC [Leptospirales bacterium]|nr:DNA recombination protein RmuC [Leptospirales bacterium]